MLLLLLLHVKVLLLLLLLLLLLHVKLLLRMWIPHLLIHPSSSVAHRIHSRRKNRNGTERVWLLLLLLLLLTKSRSRHLLASKSIASGCFLIRCLLLTLKCEHLIRKRLIFFTTRHLTDSCRRFRGVLRVLWNLSKTGFHFSDRFLFQEELVLGQLRK